MPTTSEYKLGDKVWFFMSGHKGEKTQGKIVHVFELYGVKHFVIEVETGVEPIYEVREAWTMAPTKDAPIALWLSVLNRAK